MNSNQPPHPTVGAPSAPSRSCFRFPSLLRAIPSQLAVALAFLAFCSPDFHPVRGEVIYYNSIPTLSSPAQLRRVNANGSGDQPIPVNLPSALYPTASRSGRFLLVTSPDPGRPFKISNNVFLLDLLTGGGRKLTGYEDTIITSNVILTNDLGNVGNRVITGFTTHHPYHKAISPDGTRIVVNALRRSSSVTADRPLQTGGPNDLTPASGRFPVVDIFRVDDAQPDGPFVFLGIERTGFNQGGDGVDWHPARPEIVATVSSDIQASGSAGRNSTEGTILAVFTSSFPRQFVRRLTSPIARFDAFIDISNLIFSGVTPHDYAPAIAPNGQQVAYIQHLLRQDNRFDGAGIAPLPAICSIRVVNYDGTGDREILRLNEGLWVTRVSWSPNSSRIAFDLAPQVVLNGWNSLLGDVTRSEVYTVGTDGSGITRIAVAPAAHPTWAPLFTVQPPPEPGLRATLIQGQIQLEVSNLVPGRLLRLEGTSQLGFPWVTLYEAAANQPTEVLSVPSANQAPLTLYRVVVF
jgi:hypothetical protein